MSLLNVTDVDRRIYREELKDFLPKRFIDAHTHVWRSEFVTGVDEAARSCAWPNMVASHNPVEDLVESYNLMFPENEVVPVMFGFANVAVDLKVNNDYVRDEAKKRGFGALYFAHPSESPEELEKAVLSGGFSGIKVYLEFAPSYIPTSEIRVFDFLTHEHLKVCDKHGLAVMLHIPRSGRLKDPVNYMQMLEIEEKYPNVKLLIAHLGRAYADEDLGNTLDIMKNSKTTIWDFTANTNAYVMEQVMKYFGTDRFIFGSDLPIFRMKAKRVVENGFYINVIEKGSLGDVSSDPHMREVVGPEAEEISFFLYEEILSCKKACKELGLSKEDVEKIFYKTSSQIFGIK